MIEAVNSSLVNTQALRSSVEQVSAARSTAESVPPVTVGEAPQAPKAPYISPYISIDLAHNKAVIQIRNRDTGDVKEQFPTESRLAQISQAQARIENSQRVQSAETPAPEVQRSEVLSTPTPAPAPELQSSADIITVQDVTSAPPANVSLPSPQIAVAALSAGAQSGQPTTPASVSVLA